MARRKDAPLCESVRDYCFDLLFPELAEEVPPELRRHAAACPVCRQRLADVKQLLGVFSGPQLQQHLFSRQLTGHFSLVGAKVACSDIRPFLPLLTEENPLMRFPTPITVHSDQCTQCAHDVSTIASLMLKPEQLARLSGLYSHEYHPSPDDCPRFASSIRTLAALRLEKVDSDAARHICACPACRNALYEERLRLKLQTDPIASSRIPCAAVKPVDMFDFIVPFGLDLHRRQYEKFTAVLADHLRQCPTCLEKMRQLHNIIYTIDTRGDSGVTTIYQFAPGNRQKAMANVSDQYPTWPIKVHAAGPGFEKKPIPPLISRFTKKLAQNASKPKLKQLAKLTAAAVFVAIVAVLIVKMPEARGITLSDVYSAFKGTINVHVRHMDATGETLIEQIWSSEKHGLLLITNDRRATLWDVNAGIAKSRPSDSNRVRVTALSEEALSETRELIAGFSNIMPFSDESKIPKPWTWDQISDPNLEARVLGTVIYELTWKDHAVLRSWRGFIDIRTSLPIIAEAYEKGNRDRELILQSVIQFEYPSDDEFLAAIEALKVEPESGAAGIPPSIPALSP